MESYIKIFLHDLIMSYSQQATIRHDILNIHNNFIGDYFAGESSAYLNLSN